METKQDFKAMLEAILEAYLEQITDGCEYSDEDIYQMCEGLIDDLQRLQNQIY